MASIGFSRRQTVVPAVLFLCLLTANAVPLLAQANSSGMPSGGYPVTVEGQEILRIYVGVGSFSAQDRAEGASGRLEKLLYVPEGDIANLRVSDSPYGTSIQNGDDVLLVVTDEDAKYAHLSREVLAKYYLGRIQNALRAIRQQHTARYLILAAVYAVLTLAAYLGVLWLVVVGTRRLLAYIRSTGALTRGVKIQRSEILAGRRLAAMLAGCLRLLRVVIIFVLTWIFLAAEFNYFPWTREHGRHLLNYILTPLAYIGSALLNYLPKLGYIVVIVTVMHYVLKFIRILAGEFEKGNIRITGFYPEWIQPTYKIVRVLLFAFTAVIIYPYLPGENSPAFKGIGLFIGVLISLGSTSAVANIVAGVILTYTRGFRVGDWVKIGDNMGEVTQQTMLATHMKTIKNEEIIIPNSVILNSYVTNYSMLAKTDGLILYTSVTIGYDEPWRKIHGLLVEAALKTKYILKEPVPFVLQNSLENSYVDYQLNAYTDRPLEMVFIYSDLRANIQDCFFAAGVEILSPIYSSLRDGNKTAMPAELLPKDYRPQGFRIARDDAAAAASGGKE